MNNHYEKEVLPENICKAIDNILKVNNIQDIFNYNLWIAGGFPRIIQYIKLNNLDPYRQLHKYFYETRGDIDVFAGKYSDISNFLIGKNNKECVYNSPFAINMTNSFDLVTNIQIVNKFFYKTFENCLDSFDFTNSKYLLYKDKNKYVLLKDKRADFFTKENTLNIDICASPLLSHRIVKYFNKHKIKKLSDTKETKTSIDDYLYKVAAGAWDSKFDSIVNLNEVADVYIRRMHDKINLTNNQLSILVGLFSECTYTECMGSYGVYLKYAGETDWASKKIQDKLVQQR